MSNTIGLITKYLADAENLYSVFKEGSLTADLETPNVEFVGTQTIKVPVISFSGTGMNTYSRTEGYTKKDATLSWEEYKLEMDMGDELKLDKMDLEESGTQVITFVNSYVRQVVTPSVDTYRLNKLKDEGAQTVTGALTKANVVATLDAAFTNLRDHEIPTIGSVLYLPYSAETILKNATGITKFISEGEWNGQMSSKVKMYDDAKIKYVPATRWPADTEFILVNPTCQVSTVKHNTCDFFEKVPGWRGPVVDYNMYHDTFVKKQRVAGIYVGLTKAAE